jgi:hypothetical protein
LSNRPDLKQYYQEDTLRLKHGKDDLETLIFDHQLSQLHSQINQAYLREPSVMLLIADDYGELLEVILAERELPRIQELDREEAGWASLMLMWEVQEYYRNGLGS